MSTPNKRQATDFESEEYDELSDSSESKSTKASAKKKRYDQKVKKIWFSNPKYSQFSELTEYIVMCNTWHVLFSMYLRCHLEQHQ